ncbi:hypothetical protein CCH79_00002646, partial [Gambusia affinis]
METTLREANETAITVESCQYTDVLLECNCSDLRGEFKWQKDKAIYLNGSPTESYKHRIKTFLNESSTNCSILLKNITEEDGGEYLCILDGRVYTRKSVTLQVNTNSTECQDSSVIALGPRETHKGPSTGRREIAVIRNAGSHPSFLLSATDQTWTKNKKGVRGTKQTGLEERFGKD